MQSLHLRVRSVPFLQPLPEDVIMKMSDLVEEVRMKNKKCTKHCIVRPRLLDYMRKHSRWCSGACCLQGRPLCIYHFKLSPCCISQQAGVGRHTANPSLKLLFASAGEEMHFFLFPACFFSTCTLLPLCSNAFPVCSSDALRRGRLHLPTRSCRRHLLYH